MSLLVKPEGFAEAPEVGLEVDLDDGCVLELDGRVFSDDSLLLFDLEEGSVLTMIPEGYYCNN